MSESSKYVLAEIDGEPRVISANYTPTSYEAWFCQWFAGCTRIAVSLTPHPILNEVPTCAKCAAWVERMKS